MGLSGGVGGRGAGRVSAGNLGGGGGGLNIFFRGRNSHQGFFFAYRSWFPNFFRKIRAPIKKKIGTPPPPKKTQIPPPPLKRGILWTRFFLQKERIFQASIKLTRAHFRPQNCGQKFYGHEDFSDFLSAQRFASEKMIFSTGGCPSYLSLFLQKVPLIPFLQNQ